MDTIGVEAGNTRIKFGLFKNNKLKEVFTVEHKGGSHLYIPTALGKIKPQYIALASVVPHLNEKIKQKFLDMYGKRTFIIKPPDCGIPLKIRNSGIVGVDRVLNCKAAIKLFGSPVIVVDAGTAVTVDIASEKDGFLGGVILPGADLWINSLKKTAMIKNIRHAGIRFPGRDTGEAVYGGLKYGMEGAMNNILDISFRKYPAATLVLTGGGRGTFESCLRHKKKVHRHLTIEGLGMVMKEKAGKF